MPVHQPLDPATADPVILGAQSCVYARAAITAPMLTMEALNILEEASIGRGPGALGPGAPGIIAAGRDLEHAAHEPHRVSAGMLLDEAKPHLGISAKMPMAFFNTSRSMRVRSSSRRSRAISAA